MKINIFNWVGRTLVVFMVIVMASCSNELEYYDGHGIFTQFSLVNEKGDTCKAFLITNNNVHVKVPEGFECDNLTPIFNHNGIKVELSGGKEIKTGEKKLNFSDFTNPYKFNIIDEAGRRKTMTVNLYDLPVVMIETEDEEPIISKKKRKHCELSIVNSENGEIVELGSAGVRGRGNSTWMSSDQKPFNIKFDKEVSLLGMRESRNWILLANTFFDRTQLHNAVAFEMAKMTDMPWIPRGEYVEVLLNNMYVGLYYLCEKIGIEKEKIKVKGVANINYGIGGYLLETINNAKADKGVYFVTDYLNKTGAEFKDTIFWEIKNPKGERLSQEQFDIIRGEVNHMESLIADEDSLKEGVYRKYFDIESAIDWLLVEEATENKEAKNSKNIFMFKDEYGVFHLGPPWDFDAWTFGDREKYSNYVYATALYYHQLMKDSFFRNRLAKKYIIYKKRWNQNIPKFIDIQYKKIRRSALRTDKMYDNWYLKHKPAWYNPHRIGYSYKKYDELILDMKHEIKSQLERMNNYLFNIEK